MKMRRLRFKHGMPEERHGRELLAAVEWWQAQDNFHEMTCPDHSDTPLQAFLSPAMWNVYTFCPVDGCQHTQLWIPECVLVAYRAHRFDELLAHFRETRPWVDDEILVEQARKEIYDD